MATHDYVIDNSTGANVRADINGVLQAILTNNSSSSSPSTTAAYMFWADTTSGTLKIRNSSDNAWVELLQLDGTLTLEDGSATAPSLAFRDDLNTGIFSSAANVLDITTGGVSRLQIDTSEITFNESGENTDFRIEGDSNVNLFFVDAGNNRVGIGTSSPNSLLDVSALGASDEPTFKVSSENSTIFLRTAGSSGAFPTGGGGNDGELLYFGGDFRVGIGTASKNLIFFNGSSYQERMRLDSSGRLLVGHSSARAIGGSTSRSIQIEGTGAESSMSITRNAANSAGPFFSLGKSRSSSVGGTTIVNENDVLGTISFAGADGTNLESRGVDIQALVDGTPGENDMPGRLEMKTSADGSVSPTTRMTIDSSGNTHFGGTGTLNDSNVVSIIPADGRISFGMDGRDSLVTGESGAYIFSGSGASGSILAGELVLQTRSNQNRDLHFATGGTPTMRGRFRGSDGDFFLGNDLGSITNLGTAFRENDSGQNTYMEMGHGTTGANYSYFICRFGSSGTNIGGIAQNSSGNGVTFNTSSDYRLKTNEALITDGITRIKQLKPYKFEWKSDLGTKVDGFFAHEVSSIVPEAITGEKDAVETTYYDDEKYLPEGKSIGDVKETNIPVYQAIDQSKLVPLLVAAVQELTARVETLEAA